MPLKIIKNSDDKLSSSQKTSRRTLAQAKYERAWLLNPEQFNPLLTFIQKEQIAKIEALYLHDVHQKKVADLGSGYGLLSRKAAEKGAIVTAVDISKTALQKLSDVPSIQCKQDLVPYTTLDDNAFDYVVATNIIAELPPHEHRLFFSELARIVKRDGYVIVSTPIDTQTTEAIDRLLYYAETEFEMENVQVSHHRLFLRLLSLCKKCNPLKKFLETQNKLAWVLEKITRGLYDQDGITHVILLGKKRALYHLSEGISRQ